MKEEALKLADDLQGLCEYSYVEIPDYQAMQYVDMIRKLVAENDNLFKALIAEQETKPLSEEELYDVFDKWTDTNTSWLNFGRLIEERHGIK